MITYRKAEIADCEEISKVYAESWRSAYKGLISQNYIDSITDNRWTDKMIKSLLQNEYFSLCAEDNGKVIGNIQFGKSREDDMPAYGEIISLYILPEYLGQAVGYNLLCKAIDVIKQQGFKNIYLWAMNGNIRADKFYTRNGFVKTQDIKEIEIDKQKVICYKYIKNLHNGEYYEKTIS